MSFATKEEIKYQEETITTPTTSLLNETETENLTTVVINTEEKEEKTEFLSEENKAQTSENITPVNTKPVLRKKQRQKAAPDLNRRKAQLGAAIAYGDTISKDGKDERQCD